MKLSCVIITKNEAHTIERAVKSAFKVAEEVVVIDSQSTDQTASIAQNCGAVVKVIEWPGYGKAKNFGSSIAKNNWIISIDADEELDQELIDTIKKFEAKDEVVYEFLIVMNYLGKLLRFSEYEPHWKPRLFNKNNYFWNESVVHERLVSKSNKISKRLKGKLIHFCFKDRQHHIDKIEYYAKLSAKQLIKKNKTPSILKRALGPAYRFFRSYFLKLGILEGKEGYTISRLSARLISRRHYHFDQYTKHEK